MILLKAFLQLNNIQLEFSGAYSNRNVITSLQWLYERRSVCAALTKVQRRGHLGSETLKIIKLLSVSNKFQ